jgi:spore coat polysaccharide biosynthesis protein SpsF
MATGREMRTPQEEFWAGEFGDAYTERNQGPAALAGKLSLFAEIVGKTNTVSSVLELGANRGLNLAAVRSLLPTAELSAIEINPTAVEHLVEQGFNVIEGSILEVPIPQRQYDLVFTMGVLIHIHPDHLADVYRKMAEASSKYVLIVEYYNPTPVSVTYRGIEDRLFKRDFAGEFLDAHPDFELVDYGFRYHRATFALDDCTWFLLQRAT